MIHATVWRCLRTKSSHKFGSFWANHHHFAAHRKKNVGNSLIDHQSTSTNTGWNGRKTNTLRDTGLLQWSPRTPLQNWTTQLKWIPMMQTHMRHSQPSYTEWTNRLVDEWSVRPRRHTRNKHVSRCQGMTEGDEHRPLSYWSRSVVWP